MAHSGADKANRVSWATVLFFQKLRVATGPQQVGLICCADDFSTVADIAPLPIVSPLPDVAPAPDRRRARRHRVLKAAKLGAPSAWAFVDGIVRDISATGARIECEYGYMMQDEFRLLIVSDKTIQPCRVVWRRINQLGVVFTGDAKPVPARKF